MNHARPMTNAYRRRRRVLATHRVRPARAITGPLGNAALWRAALIGLIGEVLVVAVVLGLFALGCLALGGPAWQM